ncbi:hypothetical protein [Nocardia sp. SC052]|uniref:hypothetical protein n=1 Tax=Nocardia sichangensis TaxID=3385975 RepID=UPI0039A25C6E
MSAFPAHRMVGEPGDGDKTGQLPCRASNQHDWQWHNNPQSTPRQYRMCPHCHAIDASEALEAAQCPPLGQGEPVRARDHVVYFVDDGYVSALAGDDLAKAIKNRDRFHPGGKIIEQRARMEWREVRS